MTRRKSSGGVSRAGEDNPGSMNLIGKSSGDIEAGNFFSPDLTMSGSFDLRSIESTVLGKLLNSIPIPAILLNRARTIIFANRACSQLGAAYKDLESENLSALFRHAGRAEKTGAIVEKVFSDRRARVADLVLGLGKVRLWGRMRFRSIRVRGVQHVLVLIEDLTAERRQLLLTRKYTRDLQRARDELEMRVQERTGELEAANELMRQEIERRKSIQKELNASEERYRTIFEGAPVSITEEDASELMSLVEDLITRGIGDIRKYIEEHPEFVREAARKVRMVNANDASLRLHGAETKEELLGSLERIFVDETFETFGEEIAAIASGQPIFETESVCRTLRGDRVDFLMRMAIPAKTARFRNLLVSKMDITERKRAESALSQAKEEWERTFDAVPDLVAIIDRNHRVVRINRAMAERVGLTPDEVVGQHCYKLFHGDGVLPHSCPHVRMMRDGREQIDETTEEKLGGTFLVSVTPLYNRNHELAGCVHVARDITERKRLEAELERHATRDALTGLLNRRYFMELLATNHNNALRYRFPLSLAILDLDNFKQINDRYGHQQGDKVLQRFGQAVRAELRGGDLAGRYGGDEFIIAFPYTTAENAAESLERIRLALDETTFDADSESYRVHCTAGVAEVPDDGGTVDQLISEADKAMYEAKAKGRNRVVVHRASRASNGT